MHTVFYQMYRPLKRREYSDKLKLVSHVEVRNDPFQRVVPREYFHCDLSSDAFLCSWNLHSEYVIPL